LRYQAVIDKHGSWGARAGLAYVHLKLGDLARADRLYAEAEDELTAKEMRSYAWLELQRGVLDLAYGRHDDAAAHYGRAGRAYSGYWLVDEHIAELTAAQGDIEEAAALYERILAAVPRPELRQLLGQLYAVMGRRGRARSCFVQARAGYLASVRRGGVHYYHHLADFFAEAVPDGAQAVIWARRDIALRENFSTQAALAWALMRDGQIAEAAQWMRRALASGAQDAHLYAQAAAVCRAAGETETAERHLAQARAINPRLGRFHVHR
jgi:tetratricopeptide (TPR) repeat protein